MDSELKHVCLKCIPFQEVSHSAEAIGDFLKDVFRGWRIEEKIHVIVRDNGRNVVAAMLSANFVGIPCLAHTLQLVIKVMWFKSNYTVSNVDKSKYGL